MKKQTILSIAALLVFGLGNATLAYTYSNGVSVSCSCCKGDSCPMKKKDASGKQASCCDDCDCCTADSCPMKMKGEKMAAAEMRMHGVVVSSSKAACDCSCCDHNKNN